MERMSISRWKGGEQCYHDCACGWRRARAGTLIFPSSRPRSRSAATDARYFAAPAGAAIFANAIPSGPLRAGTRSTTAQVCRSTTASHSPRLQAIHANAPSGSTQMPIGSGLFSVLSPNS
jgi:hypothetical protein